MYSMVQYIYFLTITVVCTFFYKLVLHTVCPKVWDTKSSHQYMLVEHLILDLVSLCCNNILHSFTEFWKTPVGTCSISYKIKATLVRLGIDAGREGQTSVAFQHSSSSQRC